MSDLTKNYGRRLGVALAVYVVSLIVVWLVVDRLPGPGRFAAVALAIPSLVLMVRAVWLYAKESDELQRRQLLESLAIAFAVGSLVTFTWGLMETVGAPRLPIMMAMPVYFVAWAIAQVIVQRQY